MNGHVAELYYKLDLTIGTAATGHMPQMTALYARGPT